MSLHNSQPKKIKPLHTPQVVVIQNSHTYQDFLIQRPKNAVAFKFSWQDTYCESLRAPEKKAQAKLLEALKLLKSLKEVDLTDFRAHEFGLSRALSESIFQKIAKVKSLSVMRYTYFPHKKTVVTAKWLKYFAGLQDLNYGLSADVYFPADEEEGGETEFNDPLQHLKYCPKVQALNLDIFREGCSSDSISLKFGYFPTSIKHLYFISSFDHDQLNLPLEKLQQLQSVNIDPSPDPWSHYMTALSNLLHLENFDLTFQPDFPSGFLDTWRKLTAKKQLKRLHLSLGFHFPTTQEIFDALKDCQLTHLDLIIHTSNLNLLPTISQCLANQPQLQSLKLQISGSLILKEAPGFPELCSQILNLEALRHLQLSFDSSEKGPDFISSFQRIFAKPIKIETLSLSCLQADPSVMLQELISALKSSGSSLQRLRVDLPRLLKQNSLIEIFPSLENIKELKLSELNINDKIALRNLLEAVKSFKGLTELEIGRIGGTLTQSEYTDGIERILKKRGLRKFVCKTGKHMTVKKLKIDVKDILRKNPFLQDVRIFQRAFEENLRGEIYTWI